MSSVRVGSSAEILAQVAAKHGVAVADIKARAKWKELAIARQEAMWRLKHELGLSYGTVARLMNRGDKSTVISGVRSHQARLDAMAV